MTAQTPTTLKTYFETGDRPTATQFANLIDSYINTLVATPQSIISDIVIGGSVTTSAAGNFPSVVIGSPTGGNKGTGTVNATGIYVNGTLITTTSAGGSGTVISGTVNQLAYYPSSTNSVSGTNVIPNGTTATTQSASDSTQKLATTAFANPSTTNTAAGSVTLPGGTIIKWGTATSSGTSFPNANFPFPVSFPNNVFAIAATGANNVAGNIFINYSTLNTTGVAFNTNNGASNVSGIVFNWIAIGN